MTYVLHLTHGMAYMASQILSTGLTSVMEAAQAAPLWEQLTVVPPTDLTNTTAAEWEDAPFRSITLTEKQRDLLKRACENLAGRFPVNRHSGKLALILGFE